MEIATKTNIDSLQNQITEGMIGGGELKFIDLTEYIDSSVSSRAVIPSDVFEVGKLYVIKVTFNWSAPSAGATNITLAMLFTRTEASSSPSNLPMWFTPEFVAGGTSSGYKLSASYSSAGSSAFTTLTITAPGVGTQQAINKIVALEL